MLNFLPGRLYYITINNRIFTNNRFISITRATNIIIIKKIPGDTVNYIDVPYNQAGFRTIDEVFSNFNYLFRRNPQAQLNPAVIRFKRFQHNDIPPYFLMTLALIKTKFLLIPRIIAQPYPPLERNMLCAGERERGTSLTAPSPKKVNASSSSSLSLSLLGPSSFRRSNNLEAALRQS